MLTPVLIRQMAGRTGTTLVMQLVGTSADVTYERTYPFERSYLAYLVEAQHRLARSAPSATSGPTSGVSFADLFLGRVPGIDGLGFDPEIVDMGAAGAVQFDPSCFCTIWRGFSDLVIRSAAGRSDRAPRPRFYAEKAVNGPNLKVSCPVVPLRAIRLVRDPRDVWASINSFDAQRGFHGFGRDDGQSRISYLWFLVRNIADNLGQTLPRHTESIVVRYEDLVARLADEAARIGSWLGVDLDAGAVARQRDQFRHHMTSTSEVASVGRWRTDIPAEEARFLWEQLGDELEKFGYAPD